MSKIRCETKIYENLGNIPLLNLLPSHPGRALDCGCGAGDNAKILSAQGWTVTGITISVSEQELAKKYCDRIFVIDLENGLPEEVDDIYDVILMSHVLEHLIYPENLLNDVKRVLKPDGIVAVALPNVLTYPNRLKFLMGKFEYTNSGIMDETHVRFYTYSSGHALLEKNGYRVIKSIADGRFPLWKLRNLLPKSIVAKINSIAVKLWPNLYGYQSIYLAKLLPNS